MKCNHMIKHDGEFYPVGAEVPAGYAATEVETEVETEVKAEATTPKKDTKSTSK